MVQERGFLTSRVLSFVYLTVVCLGVFPKTRTDLGDVPELQPSSLFVNDFPMEVLRLSLDLQNPKMLQRSKLSSGGFCCCTFMLDAVKCTQALESIPIGIHLLQDKANDQCREHLKSCQYLHPHVLVPGLGHDQLCPSARSHFWLQTQSLSKEKHGHHHSNGVLSLGWRLPEQPGNSANRDTRRTTGQLGTSAKSSSISDNCSCRVELVCAVLCHLMVARACFPRSPIC